MSNTEDIELKQLFSKSLTAKSILQELSLRERNRWEPMNLKRFKTILKAKGRYFDENEFINTFKDLEALDFGVLSLNDKLPTFKWTRALKTLSSNAVKPIEKQVYIFKSNNLTAKIELEGDINDIDKRSLADFIITK